MCDPINLRLNHRTVAEIQEKIVERGKRSTISGADKDAIVSWNQDLNRILQVFNVRSVGPMWWSIAEFLPGRVVGEQPSTAFRYPQKWVGGPGETTSKRDCLSTHEQQNAHRLSDSTQVSDSKRHGTSVLRSHSIPSGELPPPPPGACFGRDALVEQIVGFAENLEPFALIGAGGIGKTSISPSFTTDTLGIGLATTADSSAAISSWPLASTSSPDSPRSLAQI